MELALILIMSFIISHFIFDFFLQNEYMLGKFKDFPYFILPLTIHSLVVSLGVFLILFIVWSLYLIPFILVVQLTLVNFITHFIIDRIKASKKLLGRWNPTQPEFWLALGLDQMLHYLVYLYIAYEVCKASLM